LHRLVVPSENKILVILAFLVGLLTGVAAWGFIRLIEWVRFWPIDAGTPRWVLLIPAAGGLLCGLVVQYAEPLARGTGTSDVIYALRRRDGLIPGRYTFFKTLASLFTICSGGAAGPEAPGVAIGAGIGSLFGRWRKSSPEVVKNLTVAGAAAGFAAVFNAPIAAVLFAIEVLLREFASQAFALVILSTVTASVTTRLLLGNEVFVKVPPTYSFNHVAELFFYAILGILAAIVSKAFVQLYFFIEQAFDEWKSVPFYIKPMIGGLLIGLLTLGIPHVLGNGHVEIPQLIESEFSNPWLWQVMAVLLLGKMIATPLTIGSGGSGGIFIPFLLIGALLGGLVGRMVHIIYPAAAPAGAYMLVGMGAVFAGVTYAPFTGIILLFELTQNYSLILPLMFTVGITTMVARSLDPESIDSRKLLKKGVVMHETVELRALENYRVGELMARSVDTIPESMSLEKITEFIGRHAHTGYPVVNADGRVVGLITYTELHRTFNVEDLPENGIIARDIMRSDFPTAHADESLTEAVRRMQDRNADRVIVIDSASGQMAGILTKGDILGIYRRLLK